MQENIISLLTKQPVEPLTAAKHTLPAQLTPLIGRKQEVDAICDLLKSTQIRIITLTGAGGIAKTRLIIPTILGDSPSLSVAVHWMRSRPSIKYLMVILLQKKYWIV
jgi:hypothetical protein